MQPHPGPFSVCARHVAQRHDLALSTGEPITVAMPPSSRPAFLTSPAFGRKSAAMSMRTLGALFGGFGFLGVLSCTGAAPVSEPAPSDATASTDPAVSDINQRFAGTWRLIGVERLDADDRLLPPPASPAFGAPNAVGFLMYDPVGFMGVVIMQDGRTRYADTLPTADEARMALSSYTPTSVPTPLTRPKGSSHTTSRAA